MAKVKDEGIWFLLNEGLSELFVKGIHSDGDKVEDNGMFTQLQYKAADIKTEGSYDVFLNYRKVPTNTQIAQTWGDYADNNKGWALGFDYVPAENINFQAFYFDGKDVDDSNQKTKFVRAQVELFF